MQPSLSNIHIREVPKPTFRRSVCGKASFKMGKEMKIRQVQRKKFQIKSHTKGKKPTC